MFFPVSLLPCSTEDRHAGHTCDRLWTQTPRIPMDLCELVSNGFRPSSP